MEYDLNGIITNKLIDDALRLMLFDSLIGSILLYSLHIIPSDSANIKQLQSFTQDA